MTKRAVGVEVVGDSGSGGSEWSGQRDMYRWMGRGMES
jgi:hypothetical protein